MDELDKLLGDLTTAVEDISIDSPNPSFDIHSVLSSTIASPNFSRSCTKNPLFQPRSRSTTNPPLFDPTTTRSRSSSFNMMRQPSTFSFQPSLNGDAADADDIEKTGHHITDSNETVVVESQESIDRGLDTPTTIDVPPTPRTTLPTRRMSSGNILSTSSPQNPLGTVPETYASLDNMQSGHSRFTSLQSDTPPTVPSIRSTAITTTLHPPQSPSAPLVLAPHHHNPTPSPSSPPSTLRRLPPRLRNPKPTPPLPYRAPRRHPFPRLPRRRRTSSAASSLRYTPIPQASHASPLCDSCHEAIGVGSTIVRALGRCFHPEHFCCADVVCGKAIGGGAFVERENRPGKPFLEEGGKAYCPEDYANLFAVPCGRCRKPLLEDFVAACNTSFHVECFRCTAPDCTTLLNPVGFFQLDDSPLCEPHYHARREAVCSTCNKIILGVCVNALGGNRGWMRRRMGAGKKFKARNGKPYCGGCHVKLFG
ncbi:hypothetical protein BC829DRAFT_445904 [Chytridium lagenaria]|nr:hypothetical protein BC829DRAFT_445904 [Chytridium lagenaria]